MTFIEISIIWNICGFVLLFCAAMFDGSPTEKADGFEFCNPIWLYRQYRVNWFGAGFLALLINLICPACSLGYWLYKLCTIGRR